MSGRKKLCLISLENKRIVDFSTLSQVAERLATFGYYFDKVSRVGYTCAEEIVRALNDGGDNYENVVVVCPTQMGKTITDFYSSKFGCAFDNLGVLSYKNISVFLFFSDCENRLQYADIKEILDKKYAKSYDNMVIRAVGVPKQSLDKALVAAKNILGDGGFFNVTESYGDCCIEIVYSSTTPKMALDGAVREIVSKLDGYIYALEDITLEEQLYRLLKLRRMRIAVAESFTGGGICKRLVNVSGISEVFFEGLNTYSNQSKMGRLGVSELTLAQRGAVSAETAYQMAEGLLNTGNCEVAISTTGIAGPKSDNTSKPVGLAYIGVGLDGDVAVYKFNFAGNRENITQTAINQALFLAYKRLK